MMTMWKYVEMTQKDNPIGTWHVLKALPSDDVWQKLRETRGSET